MVLTAQETRIIENLRKAVEAEPYIEQFFAIHITPLQEDHLIHIQPLAPKPLRALRRGFYNLLQDMKKGLDKQTLLLTNFDDGILSVYTTSAGDSQDRN